MTSSPCVCPSVFTLTLISFSLLSFVFFRKKNSKWEIRMQITLAPREGIKACCPGLPEVQSHCVWLCGCGATATGCSVLLSCNVLGLAWLQVKLSCSSACSLSCTLPGPLLGLCLFQAGLCVPGDRDSLTACTGRV